MVFGFLEGLRSGLRKKRPFFKGATTITENHENMVIHATEGPKKIMVETVMLRRTAELPALCYYAKKGRIFIKVYMVYHVKLLKIDGKKNSLTWAYYANWIFNMGMVVETTIIFRIFHFLKIMVRTMLFLIKLESGRSQRSFNTNSFPLWNDFIMGPTRDF